ncbi:hypothetical protein [Roseofilum capinflatum]|uniref:DUF4384 domain-containing protein n=1 Tax=Roseofilum capinflatum BLCC-M114 TaxID=3022440 RepID=A0ABT7BDI5_9CYAN|nr:hypothetical protein [Roseofilum capinflatum]MDJ1177234.1 hypothetical protein [Roseofilum capinflatum BLCC-M114]
MAYSQPQTLQEQFLLYAKQQIFTHNRNSEAQKRCFWHRWHPDNFKEQHPAIKVKITKDLNSNSALSNINKTIQEVVEKIKTTFGQQMELDGVNLDDLKHKKTGAPSESDVGPWKVCYDWLWNKAFPRWAFGKLQKQQQVAAKPGWLELVPKDLVPNQEDHRIAVGRPNNPPQELRVNQGYLLKLQVPVPGYLLLLLREKDGSYSLCPSGAFSKQYELSESVEWIPRVNADYQDMTFNVGEAEFLAIVLRDGWPFSDFPEDEIPELTGAQMVEVWETLQTVEWQGFYRRYTVVGAGSQD